MVVGWWVVGGWLVGGVRWWAGACARPRPRGGALPARPLLLLEARHVSVGLAQRARSTDDVAAAAAAALDDVGAASAAMVGHSYGTFVLSRLVQTAPHRVQSLTLLDPVCMLTIYPQLLRNFVYKAPAWACGSLSARLKAVDAARWLFARDLTVAEAFCRRFAWHRECLWPQEMVGPGGAATLLVLAGRDDLVPSALVTRMLAAQGSAARVEAHAHAGHGGFLLDGEWRGRVLAQIQGVVSVGAAGAGKGGKAPAGVASGGCAPSAGPPTPVPKARPPARMAA